MKSRITDSFPRYRPWRSPIVPLPVQVPVPVPVPVSVPVPAVIPFPSPSPAPSPAPPGRARRRQHWLIRGWWVIASRQGYRASFPSLHAMRCHFRHLAPNRVYRVWRVGSMRGGYRTRAVFRLVMSSTLRIFVGRVAGGDGPR